MKTNKNNILLISKLRKDKDLPLWVCHMEKGQQPERLFHSHNFMEIVLIRGRGTHLLEDLAEPVSEGDLLIIPPGFVHAYADCSELEVLNLVYDYAQLYIPWLDSFQLPLFGRLFPVAVAAEKASDAVKPVLKLDSVHLDHFWEAICRLQGHVNPVEPGRNFLAMGGFLQIIGELAQFGNSATKQSIELEKMQKIIRFMSNNLQEKLNMESLARHVMMSHRNFYRYFKQMTGIAPLQYLTLLRVHKAAQLLKHSPFSLEEVAVSCGFCDANYLSRMMKQHLNISPKDVRRG